MVIEGSLAALSLSPHGSIEVTPREGESYKIMYTIVEGYRGGGAAQTQRHFAQCLLEGTPFETDGSAYLQSVRCVYACYESARQHSVERVKEH
jgi:hypothetical protein